jgi:PRTRC genetic system ThiF family protein
MINEHTLPKSLCRRGQPLRVLIVGAGGNGSAVLLGLPYLHQAMKVWGHTGGLHVMLVDGDQVSDTNCVRQPFASADVGLNKAVVLINRVNLFWGLRWQAHPEPFHKDSLRTNSASPHLIIGCVDTRAARQAILSAVTRANDSTLYWLDLGTLAFFSCVRRRRWDRRKWRVKQEVDLCKSARRGSVEREEGRGV